MRGQLACTVLRGPGGSNAARLPDQALETKARFIGQVITGDNAARRAEDIGGQELSYAEVKAIASGNPAVLTLAEADAELQRLAILKKNHADEQYLARRSLKELPETIARLTKRLADLSADLATAAAHADDPLIVGGRPCNRTDILDILGHRLDALPEKVRESTRVAIGRYRGLNFGLVLHAGGAADVFLEGSRHPPRHALPRPSRTAGGAQRPRPAGRQLPRPMRHRPARTWRSPKASSATTRPASAAPSRTTATSASWLTYATGSRPGCRRRRPSRARRPSPSWPGGSSR